MGHSVCGLAGVVGEVNEHDVALIHAMTDALHHRGPDAGGVEALEGAVLGHRRLRIIDPRPEADQPLTDERRRFWLLFNGEIYNFRELRSRLEAIGHHFVSDSDGEVIVHLTEEHGDDFPLQLRGMFAIAIWDSKDRSLLLVRDRLGIKPLYYEATGSRLVFSSEAHALPAARTGIDEFALACYLHLGWIPGPRTAYRGVLELPPGHRLRWQAGKVRVDRWYEPTPTNQRTSPDLLNGVLTDAIRRHLVADVPVGIFLSSGLDSAVIATLAASVVSDVTAYTISLNDSQDETKGAKQLAARLGLRHDVVPVSGADVLSSIEDFIMDMDQPTVDGLNSWLISQGVRSRGAVVALSGLGGDELFAGYSTFRHVPRLARMLGPSTRLPESLRGVPSALLGLANRTAHSRVRRALDAARHPDQAAFYSAVRGPMCPSEIERLRGGWGRDLRRRPPIMTDTRSPSVRDLEIEHYLANQLLRDTDVMSMAHSLEVRVPLLDDTVVAATQGNTDGLLDKKLLAASVDPKLISVAASAKQTFTLPVEGWLRGPLHGWAGDMLQVLARSGLGLDSRELWALFRDFELGRAGWRALWSLCVLGGWMRRPGRPTPL